MVWALLQTEHNELWTEPYYLRGHHREGRERLWNYVHALGWRVYLHHSNVFTTEYGAAIGTTAITVAPIDTII
jgi:hypothetical protein